MKKSALMITLLLWTGGVSFGQSLELYETVGDLDVRRQNGEVLTKEMNASQPYTFVIKVKNVKASPLSVFCKKVYLQILPNSDNTFCWDVCYISSVMVSKKPIVIQSGEIVARFEATYDSYGYSGDSHIRYVWFDGSKPTDSIAVEVVYRARPMGQNEIETNLPAMVASPNPADAYVRLNWEPVAAPGKLVLHDILGSKILEKSVGRFTKEITLNTSGFPDGLYFCLLESEGRVSAVKKIVIRH